MEETPTAPAEAPKASESVETPTNTNTSNTEPAKNVDMHGFTSEDLAGMRTFIDNNGGWEKIKSRISNPTPASEPAQLAPEAQQPQNPTSQTQAPAYKAPEGSITAEEFLAEQYFKSLSTEEKYASIADQIRNGDVLKEMASFNIHALNPDRSINDQMVRRYLDLKAQTVPAKPTETEPNASAAPTVDYVNVGENIANIDQAYQVIMQPGHPATAKAEEFIKNYLNPNSPKKSA